MKELPNAREQELLTIFMEECCEAAKQASKYKRFGGNDTEPGNFIDNKERLKHEIIDLLVIVDMLREHNLITNDPADNARKEIKRSKVMRYLRS